MQHGWADVAVLGRDVAVEADAPASPGVGERTCRTPRLRRARHGTRHTVFIVSLLQLSACHRLSSAIAKIHFCTSCSRHVLAVRAAGGGRGAPHPPLLRAPNHRNARISRYTCTTFADGPTPNRQASVFGRSPRARLGREPVGIGGHAAGHVDTTRARDWTQCGQRSSVNQERWPNGEVGRADRRARYHQRVRK